MNKASGSNREKTGEFSGWGSRELVEPGSCLEQTCGLKGHMCAGLDCLKLLSKQHEQLGFLFGKTL